VHVTHDQEEAMTMADTIAVMHEGRIEQMGAPGELYEHPRSTFVANFLGQSNLIAGRISGTDGPDVTVDVHGVSLGASSDRSARDEGAVWVGVRPEKMRLVNPSDQVSGNRLPGGVVADVSFVGVSTQYLVRLPWGQEVMAFEQNTGARRPLSLGEGVDLSWAPEHTFLLDASQDARAGDQTYLGAQA
jgi:spermidine/putrescine transport system ATP-binding protein